MAEQGEVNVCDPTAACEVRDSRVHDSAARGLRVAQGGQATLLNVSVERCMDAGIWVSDGAEVMRA